VVQTRSRRLTAQQAERVREQLIAGQQFRRQVEAYWQASEIWAEAQLDLAAAVSSASAQPLECFGLRHLQLPRHDLLTPATPRERPVLRPLR
jgi:hypothetical protein